MRPSRTGKCEDCGHYRRLTYGNYCTHCGKKQEKLSYIQPKTPKKKKNEAPKQSAKAVYPVRPGTKAETCSECQGFYALDDAGLLKEHTAEATDDPCPGSGQPPARARVGWSDTETTNSVPTISGGLPTLGKHHR